MAFPLSCPLTAVGMEEVVVPEVPPQLVRGVALRIPHPSWSGDFLRIANHSFPLQPNARHLKRIRKAQCVAVLVPPTDCPATPSGHAPRRGNEAEESSAMATSVQASLELLLGVGCSFDADLLKEFEEVSGNASPLIINTVWVPDRAPRTSPVEWTKWCTVWPFAVPKPRQASSLPIEEVTKIRRVFNESVLSLAKRGRSEETLGIAAVLIDTSQDWCVLASSDAAGLLHRSNAAACFGYVPAVESSEDHVVLDHPVTCVLKKLAHIQHTERVEKDDAPYLANNIDLFLSHEPCVMCSMALVHSRIRRVFYCFANPVHGGLGSVFSIHAISSLNHHFRVFRCSASWLCDAWHASSDSSVAHDDTSWEYLREP
ncbi:putative deaminase [Trypanosoma rangeli]|uniref:Putative deaminase n=1 Tax=Trypanosoma rangeli TaxID=5698 RepID=A0A3R7JWX4_TRYRA|nr:putative deaminase [Trypanosoma rangeli]RNE98126.1 putative deaminase [Trypanosoma rangeli]|eukprot:RNE98126.1 putative deaminase [Trypanosoma rangeli]